jgi:hypothetical protein
MASTKIRLFDGDQFVGTRTCSTIEALHARGLVRVSYNAKGYPVRAEVVHVAKLAAEPADHRRFSAPVVPTGTRYSFRDREIVAQPWDLRRLNGSPTGTSYAKGADPVAFLGVVESCLRVTPVLPEPHQLRHNYSGMPEPKVYICNCFTRIPPANSPSPASNGTRSSVISDALRWPSTSNATTRKSSAWNDCWKR